MGIVDLFHFYFSPLGGLDLANLNVARGLLMLGYTSFLLGRPLKAASYAALVGVQCHSLEKQFSRPIKCCEAVRRTLFI